MPNKLASETLKNLEKQANMVARQYMGHVAWPTILLGLAVPTVYFATLALTAMNMISVGLAFPIIAVLVYLSYSVVHDSVHGSLNGKNTKLKWLNEGLGQLNSQVTWLGYSIHRKEHFAHHRNTNIAGQDPDLPMASNGLRNMIHMVFTSPGHKLKDYFETYGDIADKREKQKVLIEVFISFAWRLGFVYFLGWKLALLFFVGAGFLGALILQLGFAWIVHRDFDRTARYENTSVIIFPKPLDTVMTWMWMFQNYHAVHHLFPRIPFYLYRKCFREIEDVMIANNAPIYRIAHPENKTHMPSLS